MWYPDSKILQEMWHPESKNCRKCGPLKKRKIVGNVDPEEVGNETKMTFCTS